MCESWRNVQLETRWRSRECKDDVVYYGDTVNFGWTKTKGSGVGVGRIGGAGERKSAIQDEEGDRGEEVKELSTTSGA